MDLVAAEGIEALTIRRVADAAGVSIGAVQHHFATKSDLLAAAFEQVIADTRARLRLIDTGGGARVVMANALTELLPIGAERRREARIYLAFAAKAAVTPTLQPLQGDLMATTRAEITQALRAAAPAERSPVDAEVDARLLYAVVDGLVLQATSAPQGQDPEHLARVLRRALALVHAAPEPARIPGRQLPPP